MTRKDQDSRVAVAQDVEVPMTLTVLSYNIHSGVGLDGLLHLGRTADVTPPAMPTWSVALPGDR